jgi:hypothetical protein
MLFDSMTSRTSPILPATRKVLVDIQVIDNGLVIGAAIDDAQAEYRLHALSRFSSLGTVMYESIKVDNGSGVLQIQKVTGHHSEFVAKLAERDSVEACADRKVGLDVQICPERQRGDLSLDGREDKTIELFRQRRGTFVSNLQVLWEMPHLLQTVRRRLGHSHSLPSCCKECHEMCRSCMLVVRTSNCSR